MEISKATQSMYYAAKLLTLAPFALTKNANGMWEVRRSIFFTIYSIAIVLSLVSLTYKGLLFDASSKMPIHASLRMRSATSMVVTVSDVSVVILSATSGTFCGLRHLQVVRELNRRLQKIDNFLDSYVNLRRDRLRTMLMLSPMLIIVCQLGFDITTWLRFASKTDAEHIKSEVNIQWYIPFYGLYLVLTGLHCIVANTVYGLSCRYRRLNMKLKDSFLRARQTSMAKERGSSNHPKLIKVKTASDWKATQLPLNDLVKLQTHEMCTATPLRYDGTGTALLRAIAENHASLCKCMALVSKAYGIAVMLIILSCLLHLVATAYFLLLQLLTKMDVGYVMLQIFWILFHTFRLLLVVEPCNMATMESKKTIKIVCEIAHDTTDPLLMEGIQKFWQQLVVFNGEFSACGLCFVNRSILTSLGSAIATYLVILIQFQNTNK